MLLPTDTALSPQPPSASPRKLAVKYSVERVVALCGLVALAPLMLAIAAAVRLSSGGRLSIANDDWG